MLLLLGFEVVFLLFSGHCKLVAVKFDWRIYVEVDLTLPQ